MSADVIDIGRACQLLRGPEAADERLRRIAIQRVAAFRRAQTITEYSDADVAMFGPIDRILAEGPGEDPRLGRGKGPSAA